MASNETLVAGDGERKKPLELIDVLMCVAVHYQVEGSACLGTCKHTWSDKLLWRCLIEMKHSPKNLQCGMNAITEATRLVIACIKGRFDVAQKLLEFGANIDATCSQGSALYMMCKDGNTTAAAFLLERGANTNAGHNFFTPLSVASKYGRIAVIKLLLENKADINVLSASNKSSLYQACYWAQTDVIRLLMSHGAKVDAGLSPVLAICMQKRLDLAQTMRVLSMLVENCANIDVVDARGRSPLLIATKRGHFEMMSFLLDKNVLCLNAHDAKGNSALHLACQRGHVQSIELLLSRGISIDKLNHRNRSPLYIACYYAHLRPVQILIAAGANMNAGEAPLLGACSALEEEEVEEEEDEDD